jgi:hypothetical protein
MTALPNPALQRFAASLTDEIVFAQVLIRRLACCYELRHVADRAHAETVLRQVPVVALRELAQSTAGGAFRPLKSAPNLNSGWRTLVSEDGELEAALNHLYPGALADWFAAQSNHPPVTHYREFTERQTGMYRITTMLNDGQVAQVARACCHPDFCLKQRLWTVPGLAGEGAAGKSLIPCLEPCAILLEFARKATRLNQEKNPPLTVAADELATLETSLETMIQHGQPAKREAEFDDAANPRRVRLLLEKIRALRAGAAAGAASEEFEEK